MRKDQDLDGLIEWIRQREISIEGLLQSARARLAIVMALVLFAFVAMGAVVGYVVHDMSSRIKVLEVRGGNDRQTIRTLRNEMERRGYEVPEDPGQ